MKNNKTKILFLGLCLGIASQSQSTDEELKKSGSGLHSSKDRINLSPQRDVLDVLDNTYFLKNLDALLTPGTKKRRNEGLENA